MSTLHKADQLFSSLPPSSCHRAIILIGTKNSGKTTLCYPLSHLPLKRVPSVDTYYGEHYLPVAQHGAFEIRSKPDDRPTLPNIKLLSPQHATTYLIDLPLLFDRREEYRLLGYYYFTRVLQIFSEVKIILTVSAHSIKDTSFYEGVEFLNKYFGEERGEVFRSLWLCFTKVDSGVGVGGVGKVVKEYWKEYEEIVEVVVGAMEGDRVFLFYKPHDPEYEEGEFEVMVEGKYWRVGEGWKGYGGGGEGGGRLDVKEMVAVGKEYQGRQEGVVGCVGVALEVIGEILEHQEISEGTAGKIAKILALHSAPYEFSE